MGRRQFSAEFKAQALALLEGNGGDVSRTARDLGINRATLQCWKGGRGTEAVRPERVEQAKAEIGDLCEEVLRAVLSEIPGKLSGASLKDLAIAAGILAERLPGLRGKVPEIELTLSADERALRVVALLDAARARRDGSAAADAAAGGAAPVH
jgi:transposase-like protein